MPRFLSRLRMLIIGGLLAAPWSSGVATPNCGLADAEWPAVPTLEVARISNLCVGSPSEAEVERLKVANPEADAAAEAARGDFRLYEPWATCEGCILVCEPYSRNESAVCSIWPGDWRQRDNGHEAEKRRWLKQNPIPPGQFDAWVTAMHKKPACVTVYGVLIGDYIARFNRAMVSDPRYPRKDMCVPMHAGQAKPQLTKQPSAKLRPATYPNFASAARFGDVSAVKSFIQKGARLEERDAWEMTALEWAVIRGYDEIAQTLMGAQGAEKQEFCGAFGQAIAYERDGLKAGLAKGCRKQSGAVAANLRNAYVNLAVEIRNPRLLRQLIEAGFELDAAAAPYVGDEAPNFMCRDSDGVGDSSGRPHRPIGAVSGDGTVRAYPSSAHDEINEVVVSALSGLTRETAFRAIKNDYPELLGYMLKHSPVLAEEIGLLNGEAVRLAVKHGSGNVLRELVFLGASLDGPGETGMPLIFDMIRYFRIEPIGADDSVHQVFLKVVANPNARAGGNGPITEESLGLKFNPGQTPLMYAIWSERLRT